MRVTAKTQEKTRAAILSAARRLFGRRGFEQTSTRELAAAAGIATGTLFNYFPSKEALATTLVAEALEGARPAWERRRRGEEALDEDLFAFVAAGLRELAPLRGIVGAVVETAMSPFRGAGAPQEAAEVRERHLETVAEILRARGRDLDAVAIHLYWTLFLGVLAFWSRDGSPSEEDTLVVLDRSMRLFVAAIEPDPEPSHGS